MMPDDEVDYEALMTGAERVLDGVDGALDRLADHTYGTCETCGTPIAEDRLAATPLVATCERHLPLGERQASRPGETVG
jgi:RNA polymerase-binding transcription factor DksA